MPRYKVGLSAREFRELADQIHDYRMDLQEKCEEFTRRLAEEGVAIAKANILSEEAIYTGELLNSMDLTAHRITFIRRAPGRNSLNLVLVLLDPKILIQILQLLDGNMIQTTTVKRDGIISRMAHGIGHKVCRQDHSCTILLLNCEA